MPQGALAIVVMAAGVVIIWAVQRYYRRRQMLAGLALRLRLRYSAADQTGLIDRLQGLYFAQQGHAARVANVLQGRRQDRELFVFDYLYEVGAGVSRAVRQCCVIAWRVNTRLPGVVGWQPAAFTPMGLFRCFGRLETGDPRFDGRFATYTDDPQAAGALLTPPLRRALLACPGVDWEAVGPWLAFYTQHVLSARQLIRLISRTSRCCRPLRRAGASGESPFVRC